MYTLFENNYAINYLIVVLELKDTKDNSMPILVEFPVLFGPVRGMKYRI